MTADSMHRCHMYLVPLRGESFFIHATQIQTQTNNDYFTKIRKGELVNSQFLGKYAFLNINKKFVRFFNIYMEATQIKTVLFLKV
jgi:hypothetical protein